MPRAARPFWQNELRPKNQAISIATVTRIEHSEIRVRPSRQQRRPRVSLALNPGYSSLIAPHALLGLEIADLAIWPLPPGVEHVALLLLAADDVAVAGDVALLVEGDAAGDGVERLAGMHHLGDLLGVERFRSFSRLFDDLYGGVAIKRISLGLEAALLAEQLDDLLVFRIVARVGRVGHQRTIGAGVRDCGGLVVGEAVAAHQGRFDALVPHLAHDHTAGVM